MGDLPDPSQDAKKLTYADRLKGKNLPPKIVVDLSTLPNPTTKEGKLAVVIPEEHYLEGCAIWKSSLIGRLYFKDLIFSDVKKNLQLQWKLGDDRIQFVPLNRGFFIIKLHAQDDKTMILEAEKWIVAQQTLTLMEWYPSFDPDKQRSSRAACWVKFPGLPMEFWIEKTLLDMGKALGNPVVVDKRTLEHEYGHFASVLIDFDFDELDTDGIHVTVGGMEFWQNFEILKKPKFCSKCVILGHSDSECHKKKKNPNKTDNSSTQLIEARRIKKEKNAPKIPFVLEVTVQAGIGSSISSEVAEVVSIKDVVELEQQLQDEFAKSEAALRLASAEFEKKKQAILSHSVLVSNARSLSTSVVNTKSDGNIELARTRILHADRNLATSSSTPLCDALEESSEYISHNRFHLLGDSSGNKTMVGQVDETARQAKHRQILALQAKLNYLQGMDSLTDNEEISQLGIRAHRGSSPGLNPSNNQAKTAKLNKTQTPKV
ncbi:uncharacterized protein LOC113296352 [Papaver somniferum]|uniref:uncharacterized protein LOC113296352 n=1 Tax=Papaver somniferum TaxID=3469 RepID=UPI000E701E3C|nr:uncharacterized protein LOC113296352 [Papaver somniferum]